MCTSSTISVLVPKSEMMRSKKIHYFVKSIFAHKGNDKMRLLSGIASKQLLICANANESEMITRVLLHLCWNTITCEIDEKISGQYILY